jgi:hypothetical protein
MNRAVLATLLVALLIDCSTSADLVNSIESLNDAALPAGTYRVAGYLVFLDDCGFCPTDAVCEPCAGSVFSVLAEEQEPGIDWAGSTQGIVEQLQSDQLLLSINLPDESRLIQGERYEMIVELTDGTRYGRGNRPATLLEFSDG